MEHKCETCARWSLTESDYGYFRACLGAEDLAHAKSDEAKVALMQKSGFGSLGREGYASTVYTMPWFACVKWTPRPAR